MARSRAVEQGIEGVVAGASGAAGEAAKAHNSGWRVPKRLVYLGFGLVALAAAAYVGVRLATAVPEARPNQHATPIVAATPYVPPTPAFSQYQRQALEQIALIGQKEPGLAGLLGQEAWTSDDRQLQAYGLRWLAEWNDSIVKGNYTLDSLLSGENKTTIVAFSKVQLRRTVVMEIVKVSMPGIEQFLGVSYKRPLLVIDTDSSSSGSSPGHINFETIDWTLRNKTHEASHQVYEIYGAYTNPWLTEGVAELAGIYAASRLPEVMPELASLMASPQWKGKDKTIPDFEKWYKNTVKIIDDPTHNPSREVAPMTKGFVFLYEFRQLVGQEAFAEAMGSLYDAKVARGAVNRNRRFTTKDIEAVLEQHVPPAQLPEFKQLYQSRVYGVQETKP